MSGEGGVYFPQNGEYTKTSSMVRVIAEVSNHRIIISETWNWINVLARIIPGKPRDLINKAFGNLSYDQGMSRFSSDYQIVNLKESVKKAET